VADPFFFDGDYYSHSVGPVRGLGLARALAHTTYRSAAELDERFGRRHQGEEDPAVGGRYQVESYLDYHAGKLLARFDANTYLIVTHSMMVHDVGTGRGGIEAALARVQARTLVVDVESPRLLPPRGRGAATKGLCREPSPFGSGLYFRQVHPTDVKPIAHDPRHTDFSAPFQPLR